MSDDKFSRFREQYKTFTYEDYHRFLTPLPFEY